MKGLIIIVLICLGIDLFGQSGCSPNLKEIYNYEIGDIYNYKYTKYDWSTGNGSPYINQSYRSFEIKNKMVYEDTIIYVIEGYLPSTTVTQIDYDPYIAFFSERVYSDTLVLIDSSLHCLNLCPDAQVEFHFPQRDTIFTKVKIENIDQIIYKGLGGIGNLYKQINNELSIFGDYQYEERYVEQIGLIYQDFIAFEARETVELASYVKGGDTTILIASNVQPLDLSDVMIFPNPVIDKLNIQFDDEMGINTLKIYDYLGKIFYSKTYKTKASSESLDISGLKNGIYILTIDTDSQKIFRKIVKSGNNNYY